MNRATQACTTAAGLVPRGKFQGYSSEDIDNRRAWVERTAGCALSHVGSYSIPSASFRGKIENPIGAAQVPLGIAGPLLVNGTDAKGTFYVPMAANEGALLRSYERGMAALTRSGGVSTRVLADENHVCPMFSFRNIAEAAAFVDSLPAHIDRIRAEAECTTRHGRLLAAECQPAGRNVIVRFRYDTGDAHGMNMIVRATERACEWIIRNTSAKSYIIFSGLDSEKRASGSLFAGGKGKKVIAGALLEARVVRTYLHTTPDQMRELWQRTVTGNIQAGALGYCGHFANGLAAIFIACGQDVANIVNSSVGMTVFEVTASADLYATVTLPSLTVATVGGGTGMGSSRECLEILGCYGSGKARKLAEIAAAALLAGELSIGAAIASGEFARAHEEYGRSRPD